MIKIYTDGSCLKNPGDGGWAAIICTDNEVKKISGSEKDTTNNRMELMATINVIKLVDPKININLYTDSNYVKNGITVWIHNWIKNNWKNSNKKIVKNKEIWLKLDEASKSLNVTWTWVKGHDGDPGNEKADFLANKGADSVS